MTHGANIRCRTTVPTSPSLRGIYAMAKPLSTRQKQILSYIHQHVQAHGYPPTVREIGLAVNLSSSSTVHAHLKTLEELGLIQRDAVLTRAIKLTEAVSDEQ